MESNRNQPVRVLFMDHVAHLSGAEQSLADLVVGLAAGPVEPVVVLPEDGPLAHRLRAHGVLVRMVPMSRRMLDTSRKTLSRSPLVAVGQMFAFMVAGWRVFRLIREVRPRIVHTNTLKTHLIALIPCRLARVPLVWHLRDILPDGWVRRAVVMLGRFTSAVIVPSRAVAEPFRGRKGVFRRLRLIPNGIRVSDFQDARRDRSLREMMGVTAGDPVVGLVARIAPWKGQDVFLRSAAMLAARHPRAHFAIIGAPVFAGDEEYERALMHMIHALGIEDRVTFAGWQPAPEAMAAIDILVHASQEPEPFGRTIVEGLAAGRPVVATAGGAVQEILPPACGFIVPPGRPELLADALDRLLADKKLRKRMGEAGAAISDSYFPVQRTIQSVAQVYRALAGKAPHRKEQTRTPKRARPQERPDFMAGFEMPARPAPSAHRARRRGRPRNQPAPMPPAARPPMDRPAIERFSADAMPIDDVAFSADAMPIDDPAFGSDAMPARDPRIVAPRAPSGGFPSPDPVASAAPVIDAPVIDAPPLAPPARKTSRPAAPLVRPQRRVRVDLDAPARPIPVAQPMRDAQPRPVSGGQTALAYAPAPVVAPPVPRRVRSAPVVPAPLAPTAPDTFSFTSKPVYDALKRALDFVLSLGLLVIGAPLWIIVAIAIKLESTGPVFHRGIVHGAGGAPFTYYKFRSMRIDGDDRAHRRFIERYVRENGGHERDGEIVYKLMGDDRVTAVGRFIRKLSFDEVPQLINVLLGQMSVVGPRPPLDYEYELYDDLARQRMVVKPGITGMQQVWHRHSASFDDKLKLDMKYIEQRSIWLDLKLIVHTPRAALRGH